MVKGTVNRWASNARVRLVSWVAEQAFATRVTLGILPVVALVVVLAGIAVDAALYNAVEKKATLVATADALAILEDVRFLPERRGVEKVSMSERVEKGFHRSKMGYIREPGKEGRLIWTSSNMPEEVANAIKTSGWSDCKEETSAVFEGSPHNIVLEEFLRLEVCRTKPASRALLYIVGVLDDKGKYLEEIVAFRWRIVVVCVAGGVVAGVVILLSAVRQMTPLSRLAKGASPVWR